MEKSTGVRFQRVRLFFVLGIVLLLGVSFFLPSGAEDEAAPLVASSSSEQTLRAPEVGLSCSASEDELIINLLDERDDAEAILEARYGLELRLNSRNSDAANLFISCVPRAKVESLLGLLNAEPAVEYAEINGLLSLSPGEDFSFALPKAGEGVSSEAWSPNDPLYMFQWNFDMVGAEEAWTRSTGKGAIVAVIDTGVAYETKRAGRKRGILVPDLADTLITPGFDFVDNDLFPYDLHGHGTHVAGTISQSTDNDYGVAGLAFGSSIMPLRVLDGQGRGNFSDVADAIRFAADEGAHVVNLSLGSFVPSLEVKSAVAYAHKKGVTIVAAAGNSGSKVRSYPAAFKHVIAVAAVDKKSAPTFYSNYGSYVDIAAPGGDTRSDPRGGIMQETLARGEDGQVILEPAFVNYMGTSMAAPHVAAAAALLIEQGIKNPTEIERLLRSTAKKGKGWKGRYGNGILDVGAATKKAQAQLQSSMSKTHHFLGFSATLFALLLSLSTLAWMKKTDSMPEGERVGVPFIAGWTLGSGALAWVLVPAGLGEVAPWFAQPLVNWDLLLGVATMNPLLASAALPVLSAGLLLGSRRGRYFTAGLALATAGALVSAACLGCFGEMPLGVTWISAVSVFAGQAWLLLNALIAAWIGATALRRA